MLSESELCFPVSAFSRWDFNKESAGERGGKKLLLLGGVGDLSALQALSSAELCLPSEACRVSLDDIVTDALL